MPDTSAAGAAGSADSALPPGDGHRRTQAAYNLIDGSWVPAASRSTFERRNPANPTELLGHFPDSGPPDVQAAARAAHAAFTGWTHRPGAERAAILDAAARLAHQRAEEIARVMSQETGKPLREARGEAARLATTAEVLRGGRVAPAR